MGDAQGLVFDTIVMTLLIIGKLWFSMGFPEKYICNEKYKRLIYEAGGYFL